MKIIVFFLAAFAVSCSIFAQKSGSYTFYIKELNGNKTLNVKGDYLGRINMEDIYHEKVDALNHKIKVVEFAYDYDAKAYIFSGMMVYTIDETLLSTSNLRPIAKKDADGKTYYVVNLKPLNEKKPLKFKQYIKSKGAFSEESNEYNVDAPFPTKEKAEAFIADLRNDMK